MILKWTSKDVFFFSVWVFQPGSIWLEVGVISTVLHSLSFLPVCIMLYRFCLTPVSLVFSSLWNFPASTYPRKLSVRRHFCDYITFSRGTTTQGFEMLGFFRALAAFISQELVLTVWDTHWSWRLLKENSLKKTGGPRKQVQFQTAWESTFYWCHWLIIFSSAKTRRVWCHFVLFSYSLAWLDGHCMFFCLVLWNVSLVLSW